MQVDLFIKSSASDFFIINVRDLYLFPKASPTVIKKTTLVNGEWGKDGFNTFLKFTNGGSVVLVVSPIDYKRKYVELTAVGGTLGKMYKRFKYVLQCFPKCEGSLVRWTIKYEKKEESDPMPIEAFNNVIEFTQSVDEFISQTKFA
ncbi:hypothetical protein ACFE04_029704 [Oxalis oulophora]